MTARELRKMLFEVDNQEMTIKELRAILFEIEDQDSELEPLDIFKATLGKQVA